ncbi:glycoside hydrolase family 3 protein [Actinoallomurus rhizosphaericola]|uniref:glycoside hydrolase family 3 protein n=1 Tax=Actinoallomurus rhizosphaericola TaxID=2952536 RepID=UPI002092C764|nr:glycoside hydrolase family 3 protein [Actinoallomurus rhizosphaericola]MCO5998778.1 glycoside hydrolase family 3 protein [Actinoallomurus rhizosphaericola]
MRRTGGLRLLSAVAVMTAAASATACGGSAARSDDGHARRTAADGRATPSATPTPTPDPVAALVRRMSTAEKVGQLFIPTVQGTTAATGAAMIAKYHPGGVIYFPNNLRTAHQTATLSNGLQRAAQKDGGVPLLIGTDEEQGIVSRLPYITHFPTNKALASTKNPDDDVRTAARVTGEELRAVGINQDFAPVADVNVNPRNPVIGVRSFGADPKVVAHLVGVAIDAYRATGVVATAKHFPGHGDTATDSHTGLPVIKHSMATWERLDAPPFKTAIAHHVDMIMTAHIVVPGLDDSGDPATMSKTVLTGLLRDKLGYDGVVVTDSLSMAGARVKYGAPEAAVRAVRAGADMLLMPPSLDGAYRAVLAAVRSGRIPQSRLDQAVTRILRMKQDRGILRSPYVDASRASDVVGSAEHRAAARRVAAHVRAGR